MSDDPTLDSRMRQAYERSREIVRHAHCRAQAAAERAARMRESLQRARTHAGATGATGTASFLQLAAEENARVLEEKERFMAVLSHELRQPLNAALAAARVIELAPSPEASARARLIMHRQLEQLQALVDDLAHMSRLRFRRSDLRLKKVDLSEIVRAAAETIESRAAEIGLVLHVRATTFLPVHGDGARLQQLFANLLANALRYTVAPGRIEVTADAEGDHALVTVRDTGQGIAAEHLLDIFEPFARGGEQQEEGLGIGLALVRSIAEVHGGSASADSDGLGHGSVFTIRLPLSSVAQPSDDPEQVSQS